MSGLRLTFVLGALIVAGCRQDMEDQPRYDPLEASNQFADGMSARTPVPGTVSRDANLSPTPERIPYPITIELLQQGQQRFDIFCSPCHGRTGDGHGMIVQRGFPAPPSYHQDALRKASDRHFYDVITNGYGAMYSYAARVPPRDRWAIVAYIRALQYSRNAPVAGLPQTLARGGGLTMNRFEQGFVVVGAAGLVLCSLAASVDAKAMLSAWLAAAIFALSLPLGALTILMVHELTGGRWGAAVCQPLRIMTAILPLALILLVPVLIRLEKLPFAFGPKAVVSSLVMLHR